MGLMTDFQKNKKAALKSATTTAGKERRGLAAVPLTAIGKQQASALFAKEIQADIDALKCIKSIKQKEAEKSTHLVPKYLPVVQALMVAGSAHPLLGQLLVWLFDIKDIHRAMKLAFYCIENKVPMPERFKRDLPTYLCDVVLEWAEAEFEAGRSTEPYFAQIREHAQHFDLPDQVTAKILRLQGLISLEQKNYGDAVVWLTQALDYGAKVKTALAEAQKGLDAGLDAAGETLQAPTPPSQTEEQQ
jgi:hypothetical protein